MLGLKRNLKDFTYFFSMFTIYFNNYFCNSIAAFSVIPRTCSGLSICRGSEVQMRLQFEFHSNDSQEKLAKRHLKEELSELRNGCHSVCCRMCWSAVLLPEM